MIFQTQLNIKKKPSAIRSSFSLASHQTPGMKPGGNRSLNNKWFKFNVVEGPSQDGRTEEGDPSIDDARSEKAINMTLHNYFQSKMGTADGQNQRERYTAPATKVFKISQAGTCNVLDFRKGVSKQGGGRQGKGGAVSHVYGMTAEKRAGAQQLRTSYGAESLKANIRVRTTKMNDTLVSNKSA